MQSINRRFGLRLIACFLVSVVCASTGDAADKAKAPEPLPKPKENIPPMPPLLPGVVTAGGQRLLLGYTNVSLSYDKVSKKLTASHPGWWVINYPLTRIKGLEGKSTDDISRLLFGRPASAVKNWYVLTPGKPPAEPAPPTGPAPIELTAKADIIVAQRHRAADDANPGTAAAPLKTISAAAKLAKPGTVIHVYPGVYRERVKISTSGTAKAPIRLEGVRDKNGQMPVISGNDVFGKNVWTPVKGCPGVYRADLFTKILGTVSADGRTLIERSIPSELKPGEYCLNRASDEFVNLRLDGRVSPRAGDKQFGLTWRLVKTDEEGFLDLSRSYGDEAANAVFWTSTWVWAKAKPQPWLWHWPRVSTKGRFRAARMTGAGMGAQVNKYRVWVNGELLPSVIFSTKDDFQAGGPRPGRNYGYSDSWETFPLREGWNHLVFQFDTTCKPKSTRFFMGLPTTHEPTITSATKPPRSTRPSGESRQYVTEYMVLGPLPAKSNPSVYVRLPGDADPNRVTMDLAARTNTLLALAGDYVHVRGFEIRHGAHYQQAGQVSVGGAGDLLAGCLIRDSEVRGVSVDLRRGDQRAAPIVIRNNWIVNPGNLGIGASGTSKHLTADNLDDPVPGRTRMLIEYNTIINSNWAGIKAFWESGCIKICQATGCVVRYNTFDGGSGPGVWFDWGNYNNRIDGNLFLDILGTAAGYEASPGPNLLASNISVNLRPLRKHHSYAFLSWNSDDRTWIVNNTLDGAWNKTHNFWLRKSTPGSGGILVRNGGDRTGNRWLGAIRGRSYAVVNNLIIGSDPAIRQDGEPDTDDLFAANFTDRGEGAQPHPQAATSVKPKRRDYRLDPASPLNALGVNNRYTALVRHDFFGLLRHDGTPRSIGAVRSSRPAPSDGQTVIEVEYSDGTTRRSEKGH